MNFPPLSLKEKQEFFNKDIPRVRTHFWRGQQFNRDWPQFATSCNTAIYWARWDDACRKYGLLDFVSLPMICNHGDSTSTSAQRDALKGLLTYLLSTKTTKTFADFM